MEDRKEPQKLIFPDSRKGFVIFPKKRKGAGDLWDLLQKSVRKLVSAQFISKKFVMN